MLRRFCCTWMENHSDIPRYSVQRCWSSEFSWQGLSGLEAEGVYIYICNRISILYINICNNIYIEQQYQFMYTYRTYKHQTLIDFWRFWHSSQHLQRKPAVSSPAGSAASAPAPWWDAPNVSNVRSVDDVEMTRQLRDESWLVGWWLVGGLYYTQ